jgi:putative hemolysin
MHMTPLGPTVVVIVTLTVLNGFFSAAEIAVLAVRRTRLEELAGDGSRGARAALALRGTPENFLATVQIGITVVGATAAAFGGANLEAPLAGWLAQLGLGSAAEGVALGLVVAFISMLSIVLGELVPKSLALRSCERVSTGVARPLLLLSRVTRPLVWLLTSLSNLILKPFRDQTTFSESRLSPDELQQLVEESAAAGSLSPSAADIASRAIELAQLPVVSLLVPRGDVATIAREATREVVWDTLKTRPHARYLVVGGNIDEIEGYVLERELIAQLMDQQEIDLPAITREVPFFVERTPAVEVLRALQQRRTKLAVVVDDQGMTSGIVTIGDMTEELLGEVLDEHERPRESVREESEGVALVRADTPVQEVNRVLGLELAVSPEYTTLGGLLMHESGTILKPGEVVQLHDDVSVEVVEATSRQIKRVRIRLPRASQPTRRA